MGRTPIWMRAGATSAEMMTYWAVVGTPMPRNKQAIIVNGRAR